MFYISLYRRHLLTASLLTFIISYHASCLNKERILTEEGGSNDGVAEHREREDKALGLPSPENILFEFDATKESSPLQKKSPRHAFAPGEMMEGRKTEQS